MTISSVHKGGKPPVKKEDSHHHQNHYRWVVLALVWLLYAVFGLIQRSIAPLVTPIIEDFSLSYSQMGIILGSWTLTYILVAMVSGAIIDGWGIRKSLFLGTIIIGLSVFLRYFASGFVTLLLFVALFGLGGPMISIGCPKTISLWFNRKDRGIAVGIYTTGPWIGGLIAFSTINSVVMPLTEYSWRLTFLVLSLLAFAAALLWWFFAKDIKYTGAEESPNIVKVFVNLIRIRNVQLILILGFFAFATSHGFNNWLPKILETSGFSPAVAGFFASIPLLFAIPSALLIPHLTPPELRRRVIITLALISAAALMAVSIVSGASLFVGLVFYGLSFPCVMPLLLLILMELPEVGSRYIGSVTGMFFCIGEIGGFMGPFIVGAVKDLTGSFLIGAYLIAGLSLCLSIITLLLKIKPLTST